MKRIQILSGICALAILSAQAEGQNPYVSEIMYVAFDFCPKGWAPLEGGLLPLSQNTAVFALLGTTFGGNGKSNFALPDMQGRFAVGNGQGLGLENVNIGQSDGSHTKTLNITQVPLHNHTLNLLGTTEGSYSNWNLNEKIALNSAGALTAEERLPRNNQLAASQLAQYSTIDTTFKDSLTVVRAKWGPDSARTNAVGQGLPMTVSPPYVTLKACIAMQGVFPPRN
jgi:microcystin-dependent protein